MTERPRNIKGSWRSPAQGWPNRHPTEVARFVFFFRDDDRMPYMRGLRRVLSRLIGILGDHTVHVCTSIKPAAWGGSLGWRSAHGGHTAALSLPLSELCRPEVWSELVHACEWPPSFKAFRGGGKFRHEVWSLDNSFGGVSGGGIETMQFFIATRHIHENEHRAARRAALSLLRLFAKSVPLVEGWGELEEPGHLDRSGEPQNFARQIEHQVRWLTFRGPLPLVMAMRRAIVLTPPQLAALGGICAFRERAAAAERALHEQNPYRSRLRWPSQIRRAGDGALLVHGLEGTLLSNASPYGGVSSNCTESIWFMQELVRAGIFAPARTDLITWQKQEQARLDRVGPFPTGASGFEFARGQKHRVARAPASLHLSARVPRVCPFGATRAASVPGDFQLGEHLTAFSLSARDLAPGVTIYARRTHEGGFHAPVLVGSLDPDRASLFFDQRIHGWDGESSSNPSKSRSLGRLTQLVCPKCQSRHFKAWAVFEYPEDLAESLKPADLERAQDFFTWFWLVVECASCRWSETVVDVECA